MGLFKILVYVTILSLLHLWKKLKLFIKTLTFPCIFCTFYDDFLAVLARRAVDV